MSDDALIAHADRAELARLHTELRDLRAAYNQLERSRDAERAARTKAETVNIVLRQVLQTCRRDASNAYIRHLCTGILKSNDAGAALRAELDAAASVVNAARIACERALFPGRGVLVARIAAYDDAVAKGEPR